jgi:glucosyl-3-phosphoglycerate synthase
MAVPFEIDYGVEIGLLIDVSRAYGVESIAQVDLGARTHRNRPLSELHEQAIQVLRSALARNTAFAMDADATIRPALDSLNQDEQTSASGE